MELMVSWKHSRHYTKEPWSMGDLGIWKIFFKKINAHVHIIKSKKNNSLKVGCVITLYWEEFHRKLGGVHGETFNYCTRFDMDFTLKSPSSDHNLSVVV